MSDNQQWPDGWRCKHEGDNDSPWMDIGAWYLVNDDLHEWAIYDGRMTRDEVIAALKHNPDGTRMMA